MFSNTFCIRFSGIRIQFNIPGEYSGQAWKDDLLSTDESCDAAFTVQLLYSPLQVPATHFYKNYKYTIYQTDEGQLRIYHEITAADGCQVACLLRPDNHHTLYYPASRWDFYAHPLNCLHLIAPEHILIRKNAFLLHSSVVALHGKTVLFAGPSTAGKSTQASLWQTHLGAEILNGDRCVVMQRDGQFWGGGSPWAGTSGIYRPEQYPIAGIVLLGKSPENRIRRMGADAFAPLFGQTLVNSWDREFMETVTSLYADLLAQVPVYHLDCRPDADAVALAYQTIFGKEMPDGTR